MSVQLRLRLIKLQGIKPKMMTKPEKTQNPLFSPTPPNDWLKKSNDNTLESVQIVSGKGIKGGAT